MTFPKDPASAPPLFMRSPSVISYDCGLRVLRAFDHRLIIMPSYPSQGSMGSRFVDLADVPRGVRIPYTWWGLRGVSKISLRRVANVLECSPSRIRMRRNRGRKRNHEGLATVRCCEISENLLTAHVHVASGKTVRVCQRTGLAHAIVSHLGSTANPTCVRNLRSGLQP